MITALSFALYAAGALTLGWMVLTDREINPAAVALLTLGAILFVSSFGEI